MTKPKKLTQFECGFVVCLCSLASGYGASQTEVGELWREIGSPTPEQAKKSGMTEFDIDQLERINEVWA